LIAIPVCRKIDLPTKKTNYPEGKGFLLFI